jgi:DNA-directed RNA polymerase alpha subunit
MKEVSIVPNAQEDVPVVITIFSPETPISRLGFSQRSFRALTKNGYNTVTRLLTLDEEALGAIENLGKKSIKEIRIVQEQLQRQTKTVVDWTLPRSVDTIKQPALS